MGPGTFSKRPYDTAADGETVRVEKNLDEASSTLRVISSVQEMHETTKLGDADEKCELMVTLYTP